MKRTTVSTWFVHIAEVNKEILGNSLKKIPRSTIAKVARKHSHVGQSETLFIELGSRDRAVWRVECSRNLDYLRTATGFMLMRT